MSRIATSWVWEQTLKPSQKLLLLSLADRADEHHCCYPSITRLMHDTGLDKKTIGKWINEMIQQGLLIDTGERKGITKRVRVLKLNLDFEFTQKGDHSTKANKPKIGNVPKNGFLNDPKNGSLNQSLESKNNTHTANHHSEPVDNFATHPDSGHGENQMRFGEGQVIRTRSSPAIAPTKRKSSCGKWRYPNKRPDDANVRLKNQIALELRPAPAPADQTGERCKRTASHPADKFVMFVGWRPSSGLRDTARKIGIELSGPPDQARLADFVAYWEADGAAYNQTQWEMKLARSITKQRQRAPKRHRSRREFMASSGMDYTIPEGFRG